MLTCVEFKAAPRVNRFEFASGLKLDGRANVFCSIDSGSPPFQFEWLKNGSPITTDDRIDIGMSKGASFLTIIQLKREDVGNFTCVARNSGGFDSFTAPLIIRSKLF